MASPASPNALSSSSSGGSSISSSSGSSSISNNNNNNNANSTVAASFHWTEGGRTVVLVGSWSNWKDYIPMTREQYLASAESSPFRPDGPGGSPASSPPTPKSILARSIPAEVSDVFSVTVDLHPGIHSYKFIVDGVWRYAKDQPTLPDRSGNINNCCSISRLRNSDDLPTVWQAPPVQHAQKMLHAQLLLPGVQELPAVPRSSVPGPRVRLTDVDYSTEAQGATARKLFMMRNASLGNFAATSNSTPATSVHRLMLVMVGLPARGKSFIARKLCRYLNWLGYSCKVFNLGSYRRQNLGNYHSHDFFKPDNPEGQKQRAEIALEALADAVRWFKESDGRVAIYDGTNSTHARRQMLLDRVKQERPDLRIKTIFIEVICNDAEIIETNIRATKLSCPDYAGQDPEAAVRDFRERIDHYKQAYETMGLKDDLRYIKIFDVGRQIVANRINGFVPSRIVFYLNNLHIIPRPIYITRHGQSEYNVLDKLGGDSPLTPKGHEFAELLKEFMISQDFDAETELCVWSSTMKRAVQTAEIIPCAQYVRWKSMEEINVGVCDGLSYEEVEGRMPDEFAARAKDKLRYRYPRGESYEDLIRRLDPVIIELERQRKPILIVAHRAVLRCLYAYFADENDRDQVPHVAIPLHTVIRLKPHAYGTLVERFKLMEGKD